REDDLSHPLVRYPDGTRERMGERILRRDGQMREHPAAGGDVKISIGVVEQRCRLSQRPSECGDCDDQRPGWDQAVSQPLLRAEALGLAKDPKREIHLAKELNDPRMDSAGKCLTDEKQGRWAVLALIMLAGAALQDRQASRRCGRCGC